MIEMIYLWIAAVLSISGAILNAKKNRWGFILWIIGNVGWIIADIIYGMYEQIVVWLFLTATSIYGFREWSKPLSSSKAIP